MQALRNAIHYLFSILLWILFGYYWYIVSGRKISLETFQAVIILAVVSLLGLAATALWVRHNLNIARHNRRGAPAPAPAETLGHDYLGRPVRGPGLDRLRAAKVISITLDDGNAKVLATSGGEGS